jgi:hypothetical protein
MSRREALLSAGLVFVVALAVRAWAATQIVFPRPEDVAYYVGVARNLVEGRGLVSDAIWSFGTPPLDFPRPAFEVWLPLPSFLAAVPMLAFGTTFAAAQLSSIVVGSIVSVLAWRLGTDVAAARSMPVGRARTLALGAGLTSAVYLPLVLASAQPDSTMPFAAFVLGACLLMARLERSSAAQPPSTLDLLGLGVVLGLAALTRNEAIWLAVAWAVVAWGLAGRPGAAAGGYVGEGGGRLLPWVGLVGPVAVVALLVLAPWAIRDWLEFGSPLPGQALTNALSLAGTDIFAWRDQPTVSRYLAAGLPKLLELRWTGTVHNVVSVLLFLGVPLSVVGLIGLPAAWRQSAVAPHSAAGAGASAGAPQSAATTDTSDVCPNPLRPLFLFSIITFAVASLVFPVSTTWGTFLHAAGAIHVLLVISALLVLDWLIGWVGQRRGWTNPVAWLGPAFAIAGCLLFSFVLLTGDGRASRDVGTHWSEKAAALRDPSFALPIDTEPGPIITDFPIWLAESTGHHTLALPNESPESVQSLAAAFDPPARLVVLGIDNDGAFLAGLTNGDPGSECFVPLPLPLDDVFAFRIRC